MTAGVPIIDLDAPVPRAEARRRPAAPPRAAFVLGLLVLALATLGAAVAPGRGPSELVAVGGQPAAAFELGADTLYTAHYGNNPNSESAVRRWHLPDGSLRWAAAVPQNVESLALDPLGHLLLARSGNEPRATFLDADTGAQLWRLAAANTAVVGLAAGAALIRTDLNAAVSRLQLVDGRTGRQIWSRVLGAVAALNPDEIAGAPPARIVAVAITGQVTVLRWTDGAVLAAGDLHVRLPTQADYSRTAADFLGVSAVGDRVYVSRRDRGRASMDAFSVLPFRRMWSRQGGPAGFVADCGVVLCVHDTRFVVAIDPATGVVRWTAPDIGTATRLDRTTLLGYDQQENPTAAVLDARTGRITQRLGQTFQVGGLLLRLDDVVPGRTWVSVADPVDGIRHALGAVAVGAPFGCESREAYLACPTVNGPTVVWRVPKG